MLNNDTNITELVKNGAKWETIVMGLTNVELENIVYTNITNPYDVFTIGNTASATLEFEVVNPKQDIEGKIIDFIQSIEVNGFAEMFFIGKFKILKPTIDKGIAKYKCVDRMTYLMSDKYVPQLTVPTTDIAILEDIASQTGIRVITENLVPHDITYLTNAYSKREIIGYIAALQGKNAYFTGEGSLSFKFYDTVDYTVDDDRIYFDIPTNINSEKDFNCQYINCSVYVNGTQTELSSGNGNMGMSIVNPFMTQTILDEVLLKVSTLTFRPMEIQFLGDFRLQCGDVITVNTGGNTYTVPIMQITHSSDGGVITNIVSIAQTESENAIEVEGELTRKFKEMLFDLVETREITENNTQRIIEQGTQIEATQGAITSKVWRTDISIDNQNLILLENIQPHTQTELDKTQYLANGTYISSTRYASGAVRFDSKKIYEPNTDYILSGYFQLLEGTVVNFNVYNGKNHILREFTIDGQPYDNPFGRSIVGANNLLNDANEHYFVLKFTTANTIPNDTDVLYTYIQPNQNSTEYIKYQVRGLKLEKGNGNATQWSVSPVDTETIASQTATQMSWLVRNGDSATNFTLTDRTAELVSEQINLKGLVTFSGLSDTAKEDIVNSTSVDSQNLILFDNLNYYGSSDTELNKSEYMQNGTVTLATSFNTGAVRFDSKNIYQINTEYILSGYVQVLEGTIENFRVFNGKNHRFISLTIDDVSYTTPFDTNMTDANDVLSDGNEHYFVLRYKTASTIPADSNVSYTFMQLNGYTTTYIKYQIRGFKLEKGNGKPTSWNLNTIDIDNSISKATNSAIVSVDVMYASSTSPTVAPTEGWSTTAPTWEEGKYIWQKTVTTLKDGTTNTSQPTNITGAKGKDGTSVTILGSYNTESELNNAHPTGNMGDAYIVNGYLYVWNGSAWENVGKIQGDKGETGQTGIGVSAIVEQYYLSNSSTTQSGGNWSTTQPSWSNGKYIWTRSRITWTDNTTTYTSPILAQAINSANINADNATTTANNANTIANEANNKAETAISTAETATNTASNVDKVLKEWAVIENNQTVIDGNKIYTGSITAQKINLTDLFSQNITATNFNMTGGSIKIQTNNATDSIIELKVNDSNFTGVTPTGIVLSFNGKQAFLTGASLGFEHTFINDEQVFIEHIDDTIVPFVVNGHNRQAQIFSNAFQIETLNDNGETEYQTLSNQGLFVSKAYYHNDVNWTDINEFCAYKCQTGIVSITGSASENMTLVANEYTTIATLPVGYRPERTLYFNVNALGGDNATLVGMVTTEGLVRIYSRTEQNYFSYTFNFTI